MFPSNMLLFLMRYIKFTCNSRPEYLTGALSYLSCHEFYFKLHVDMHVKLVIAGYQINNNLTLRTICFGTFKMNININKSKCFSNISIVQNICIFQLIISCVDLLPQLHDSENI